MPHVCRHPNKNNNDNSTTITTTTNNNIAVDFIRECIQPTSLNKKKFKNK